MMNSSYVEVPPGFRFHPTDEELVDYYLRRKIASRRIDLDVIKDVDLYRIEPWDLQEVCRIGKEEQKEWYFFSHKDKKYPSGTRTNRATAVGFWKATGRDKPIYRTRTQTQTQTQLIGMRKTLVFYKGRAPNGLKSDWIMHEYRLQTDENGHCQEEGWVVCRVFKKKMATTRKLNEYDDSSVWYDDHFPFMDSPTQSNLPYSLSCKKEMDNLPYGSMDHHFLQLPHLESPNFPEPHSIITYGSGPGSNNIPSTQEHTLHPPLDDHLIFRNIHSDRQVTDWRVLDKFVASQLSHEESSDILVSTKQENGPENASTSSSSGHIDLWR